MQHTDIFNSSPQDTLARLRLLYGNALGGLFITLLCMGVLCFGFDTPEQQKLKTSIFVILVISHVLRFTENTLTLHQIKQKTANHKTLIVRFTVGIMINSTIWASYSFLLVPTMSGIEITVSAVILSALAGGATTILAASGLLARFYMSCLILPYAIMGLFNEFEYFHYISYLGFGFWFVMLLSSKQAANFVSETLTLKNKNSELVLLMDQEKQEVERVNNELLSANKQLDEYTASLEEKVENRTKEIYRLSNLDSLTGLSNRSAFLEQLKERVLLAKSKREQFALLFIDLDGFKDVNDGFGHKIGDSVLSEIGHRLLTLLNETQPINSQKAVLCRWGGDEFLVLYPTDSKSVTTAPSPAIEKLSAEIQKRVAKSINIASNEIHLGASIGIAKYPEDTEEPQQLIQYADISMYYHKEFGQGNATYFSLDLFAEFQRDQLIRDGLKLALEKQEFSLVYQPIVDIQDDELVCFEALLRWEHQGNFISPVEFIPMAEKSGRINDIGAWVLQRACMDATTWHFDALSAKRNKQPGVSVNVSCIQLVDDSFIATVESALVLSGLPAENLHLEITESVLFENEALALSQLAHLSKLGVHVSIDDFGTGFSSLSQLKAMHFDVVKIDRSFIIELSKQDLTIISATKLIADQFNARMVAEGIETEHQLAILKSGGIRYIQGYYIARPMPLKQINAWVSKFFV
ncbi:EAL domain-containing protein [Glaciecola sp. MH2013]|uniref:putative bifunctional diguanylate cyclase/phosphodiesterase n=1 Tax=Glaciecola sp. MH2013 TaxID=2785524 RepID=UPI00189EA1DA|nr:EAL domain-containing protein [Glaciecola sp. MH2013]MBF7072136.1 EAL domain-containing protein [Glaciecola sp. MH2013]